MKSLHIWGGGSKHVELKLDWDYNKKKVNLSMLDYMQKALKWFNHQKLKKIQHQQYPHVPPQYGAKI